MLKRLEEITVFTAGDLTDIQEILKPSPGKEDLPYSLALATLPVGKSSLPHRLVKSAEVYFILSGMGEMHLDEKTFETGTGDTVYIPANSLQWIQNTGQVPLRFLCIVSPPWEKEDEYIVPVEVGSGNGDLHADYTVDNG